MHYRFLFREEPEQELLTVLIVDLHDFGDPKYPIETLYQENQLERVTNMIVRAPVDKSHNAPWDEFDEVIRHYKSRVPHASINILYSENWMLRLSENLNGDAINASFISHFDSAEDAVKWLRAKELSDIIENSNSIISSQKGFIYKTPSGRYCRSFLRVGNSQISRNIMDTYFFWLIPHLKSVEAIVAETWSITSTVFNVARLAERYRTGAGDQNLNQGAIRVDTLTRYHHGDERTDDEIGEVLDRVTEGKRNVLIIISAVMTGRSLTKLKKSLQARRRLVEGKNLEFVAMFKLSESVGIEALCDFSKSEKYNFHAKTKNQDDTVVTIDDVTYLPLKVGTNEIEIKKKLADPSRTFFETYQATGVICTHRTSKISGDQPGPHRGVYLDVEKMLEIDDFKKKFHRKLSVLEKTPVLIVHPPHSAGLRLAEMAAEYFSKINGDTPKTFEHIDLKMNCSEYPDEILGANERDILMLLDDTTATGNRLGSYQKHLREIKFPAQLFFMVGVARPTKMNDWERRKSFYKFRKGELPDHIVDAVEEIALPHWDSRSCPWCKERKILIELMKHLGDSTDAKRVISERISILEQAEDREGLTHNAVWDGGSGELPKFSGNSVLFEDDQALSSDVIVSAAAAIQYQQTSGDGDQLGVNYPHQTVIKHDDYLGGEKFTDLIIRIGILRSARPVDLNYWGEEQEHARAENLKPFFCITDGKLHKLDDCPRANRLEFLIAILSKKLPMPSFSKQELNSIKESDAIFFDIFLAAQKMLSASEDLQNV